MKEKTEKTNDEMIKISEMVKVEMPKLISLDNWIQNLKVMSRFPNLSYRNTFIVNLLSDGTATNVKTLDAWNKSGRSIKRGSKSLKLIEPCMVKHQTEKILIDDRGNAKISTNGQIMTEEQTSSVSSFKAVSVFDIKDTEGEPLPSKLIDNLKDMDNRLSIINNAIIDTLAPSPYAEKIISGSEERGNIHDLLHQLAEKTLQTVSNEIVTTPSELTSLEIESASFVAMNHLLGEDILPVDNAIYSFSDLSLLKEGADNIKIIKNCLNDVQKASAEMINRIDTKIEELILYQLDEIAYKISDGYLYIQTSNAGYDYSLYNNTLQLLDGGRLDDISIRIDKAAIEILKMSDIPSTNLSYFSPEKFKDELHKLIQKRQILATEICISCYGEDPLAESYVGPSEQSVYSMLSNGIAGDFYNTLMLIPATGHRSHTKGTNRTGRGFMKALISLNPIYQS